MTAVNIALAVIIAIAVGILGFAAAVIINELAGPAIGRSLRWLFDVSDSPAFALEAAGRHAAVQDMPQPSGTEGLGARLLTRTSSCPDPECGCSCLRWTGEHDKDGYGRISIGGGRKTGVHRVAWELKIGPIPDGLVIDHVVARGCVHRDCVNVLHLEPVTVRENSHRGQTLNAMNAAKTVCDNGHPYDEVNTYIRPNGRRDCKICSRARKRASRNRARSQDDLTEPTLAEVTDWFDKIRYDEPPPPRFVRTTPIAPGVYVPLSDDTATDLPRFATPDGRLTQPVEAEPGQPYYPRSGPPAWAPARRDVRVPCTENPPDWLDQLFADHLPDWYRRPALAAA